MKDPICPGCEVPMRVADVLCKSCLAKLPRRHVTRLNRTWAAFSTTGSHKSQDAYIASYKAAVAAAKYIARGSVADRPRR